MPFALSNQVKSLNNFPHTVKLFYILGIFCLCYWFIDAMNIVFFVQKPYFLLWYSNVGLLFTGIALISQNRKLIFSLFCSHFVVEVIWCISFFSLILFHQGIPGVADYAFQPDFSRKDFYMTLYHVIIPPILLWAVLNDKASYKYGWIGACFFALTISLITYYFTDPWENVNCIHNIDYCRSFLTPLAKMFTNPQRIYVAVLILTVVIYIPTNLAILRLKSYLRQRQYSHVLRT